MATSKTDDRRIKVVDFSTHVSGPTASLFLRSVGADVVKVENERIGDGNRAVPAAPTIDGHSIYHQALNWGARSIAADAKGEEWPAWVRAMTRWADVVIIGGRPSDAKRLGLDRETIAAIDPQVIHCHISGYGSAGPWMERAAHGQNPDALAGLVDLQVDDDGNPQPIGWRPAGTSFAGVAAAVGILGALWHRSERGVVLNVETSLWESAIWWNWRELTAEANLHEEWGRIRDFGSRYATYRTSDGPAVLVAPIEEKFWRAFCDVAGLDELRETGDWASRYDFGEQAESGPERTQIGRAIAEKPLGEWLQLLEPTGVPFCEILGATDVVNVPQVEAMGMFVPLASSGVAIRPPVRLTSADEVAFPPDGRLPDLGADTDDFRPLMERELRQEER